MTYQLYDVISNPWLLVKLFDRDINTVFNSPQKIIKFRVDISKVVGIPILYTNVINKLFLIKLRKVALEDLVWFGFINFPID